MSERDEAFARHEREQRARWLALTPEERLLWLERAKRFARLARDAAAAKGSGSRAVKRLPFDPD
jgi:hypothetical protein